MTDIVCKNALKTATIGEVMFADSKLGKLIVKCGDTALDILNLQASGKKALNTAEFLRGYQISCGDIFK